MTDFERSWARFQTYHEVNGLRPTLEHWRRWVAAEARQRALRNDRSLPNEQVIPLLLVGGLIVASALGAGVAYVFGRALCGGLQ